MMNLIGHIGLTTTAYKNSDKIPIIPVGYEVIETPSGEYTVSYSPDIVIPLLNPLTGQATGDSLPIASLLAIMYSVYEFARAYIPAEAAEENI